MTGRKFTAGNGYRYGFNGKENDNEVKGDGNQQDYGMRIYDPRLGKFLSVDPVASEYPWNSTYSFAENDPINFIDLDGLEQATPPRPGSGRSSGRVNPYWRHQAEGAARSLIRGQQRQEREELIRHTNRLNNDPQYRAQQQFTGGLIQNQQANTYWRNAFNSASIALTGGDVQQNRTIGNAWDKFVNLSMIASGNYISVATQISLKVTGMVNGQMTVANIRIDNVGIRTNPATGKPVFDLKEAKYSIGQITINNVLQTLTPQQRNAANILINGSNVQIFLKGDGSTANMNAALRGTGQILSKGQNITGQIENINIVVPKQASSGNSSSK